MSNPHRLMYSKANQAFVFTLGDQLLRIGDNSMFYRNKADAVRAALKAGLVVDAKGFVTSVESEQLNGSDADAGLSEALEGANWALVKAEGIMDDRVLSTHNTKEAAQKAMIKRGGTPDSMFQNGMRIVDVGPGGSSEMIEVMGKRTIRPRSRSGGMGDVSARSRQGTRVRFNPSPGSLVLYTHHPEPGEEGSVTTMPGFGKRTYLPGPGGGLLYVKWDQSGTIGVSPKDVDKVSGSAFSKRGGLKVGAGRPGQKFTHGDVEITTTLHPVIGSDDLEGLNKRDKLQSLDTFTQQYIATALWSSTDNADDSGGEPLDANYDTMDLTHETLDQMIKDCKNFQADNAELLAQAGDEGQNGHDFWLTRNRHGAGFWDRGYDKTIADALTRQAHVYGSVDLMVSGGKIHSS
jgi:hypothetical protein